MEAVGGWGAAGKEEVMAGGLPLLSLLPLCSCGAGARGRGAAGGGVFRGGGRGELGPPRRQGPHLPPAARNRVIPCGTVCFWCTEYGVLLIPETRSFACGTEA